MIAELRTDAEGSAAGGEWLANAMQSSSGRACRRSFRRSRRSVPRRRPATPPPARTPDPGSRSRRVPPPALHRPCRRSPSSRRLIRPDSRPPPSWPGLRRVRTRRGRPAKAGADRSAKAAGQLKEGCGRLLFCDDSRKPRAAGTAKTATRSSRNVGGCASSTRARHGSGPTLPPVSLHDTHRNVRGHAQRAA